MAYVMDAWPILELYRQRQPSSRRIQAFLHQAAIEGSTLLMSRINYGEVRYNTLGYLGLDRASVLLARLPEFINLVSVDDELVDQAADLKFKYKAGYADCFAAALAVRHNAAVVTGDPHFLELESAGLLRVHWLGA